MKKLLLASAGLLAIGCASARAADIPPRLPLPARSTPVYVPFFTWNGIYAGVYGGYGWGTSNWTATGGATTGDFDVDGGLVGGTLGYNMQLGGFIFGLETDIGWSGIKGSVTTGCLPSCDTELQWLGTGRGRIGYAFDRFLPYLTGGAAFGDVRVSQPAGSFTETRVGWTLGGGMEWAFSGNWTAKVEYLYVDLGEVTCDATCSGTVPFEASFKASILRAGLNYRF